MLRTTLLTTALATAVAFGAQAAGQQSGQADYQQDQMGQQQTQMKEQMGQQQAQGGQGAPLFVSPDAIRDVQQALKDEGHDITVDGIWGPNTQAALRDYQQQQGMSATGNLNVATLDSLGIDEIFTTQQAEVPEGEFRPDQASPDDGVEALEEQEPLEGTQTE